MTPDELSKHARLIAAYCKRPELEAMLLDERLAYFAMHEAEKTLDSFQRELMTSHLIKILNPARTDNYDPDRDGAPMLAWRGVFTVYHATAAQRADAFLRAINTEAAA